jgi:hypothetical protein
MRSLVCANCGVEIVGGRKDRKWCSSACGNNVRGRRWKEANPERVITDRRKHNTDATKRMITRTRHRAKCLGIPFTITADDFAIPSVCPVLGIPLHITAGRGRQGYFPDSPSLDRLIPEVGYVPGNVRVISARANLLKSDAGASELRAVLNDLERIENEIARI